MNKVFLFLFLLFIQLKVMAASGLPIDTLNSRDASKPLVIYITGDGGLNNFSTSFMKEWNNKGYPIVALNAKSYFWHSKTPETASADVSNLINQYLRLWHRSDVILIGYSLGADVLPFIQTRLAVTLQNQVKHIMLLSPSNSTDFTVHLFYSSNEGNSVPAEINKISKPTLIVFGKDEDNTPEGQIKNKAVSIVKVEGDHHYNNDVPSLVSQMAARM